MTTVTCFNRSDVPTVASDQPQRTFGNAHLRCQEGKFRMPTVQPNPCEFCKNRDRRSSESTTSTSEATAFAVSVAGRKLAHFAEQERRQRLRRPTGGVRTSTRRPTLQILDDRESATANSDAASTSFGADSWRQNQPISSVMTSVGWGNCSHPHGEVKSGLPSTGLAR